MYNYVCWQLIHANFCIYCITTELLSYEINLSRVHLIYNYERLAAEMHQVNKLYSFTSFSQVRFHKKIVKRNSICMQ